MSKPPTALPTIPQIDGVSFLGGGVRCPTHQLPPLFLAMYRKGLTLEELLHGVKYMSCNSGGSFTLTSLLCYPLYEDAFPVNSIATMKAGPKDALPDALLDFYAKYWIDVVKSSFPSSLSPIVFQTLEKAEIALFSWLNGVGTLAMLPFANYIKDLPFKDLPVAKKNNIVVSFGATTIKNSNIRVVPNDFYQHVAYQWTKTYDGFVPNSGMVGFPINLHYGFGNVPPKGAVDVTLFNGKMGGITYVQSKTPAADCKVTVPSADDAVWGAGLAPIRFAHQKRGRGVAPPPPPPVVPKPVPVPNPANLSLASPDCSLGDSMLLTLVAATSAYTGCTNSGDSPPNPSMTPCEYNAIFYGQPVILDYAKGELLANTKNKVTSYPQMPWSDNGSLDLAAAAKPSYLNLCDGANSSDNTGIIPMLVAMQAHEDPKTLATKTYEIVYFDGPDTNDDRDIPSSNHLERLFNDSDAQSGPSYGIQVFDQSIHDFKSQFNSSPTCQQAGTELCVTIFRYENLTTHDNAFVGVRKGIKVNLTVFSPLTQLGTAYASYDDLDVHIKTNQQLLQIYDGMDKTTHWIDRVFSAPPATFGCDPLTLSCRQGTGKYKMSDCFATCHAPAPAPPPPSPSPCPSGNTALSKPMWDASIASFAVAGVLLVVVVILAVLLARAKASAAP
jgi:hypothetical protein